MVYFVKFFGVVDMVFKEEKEFDFVKQVLLVEFVGLEEKEKRVIIVFNDFKYVCELVKKQVDEEFKVFGYQRRNFI